MIIEKYTVTQKIKTFNESIEVWIAENIKGNTFEIITIKSIVEENRKFKRLIERVFKSEIKPLINQEITGFQKVIEIGYNTNEKCYFIIFEYLEGYEFLTEENGNILSLIEIVKGLDYLKKQNIQTYIINPSSIVIDNHGQAKLKYIGLFEIFKYFNLLDKDYLSLNTVKWLNEKKQPRPNFQDDIYSLIKSFEFLFDKEIEINNIILNKSLNVNRVERFSKYHELLDCLDCIPIKLNRTRFEKTIKVVTQRDFRNNFEELVQDMNLTTWLKVDNERSEKDNQVKGQFSTNDWKGNFYVDEQNYLFIDFKSCKSGKNDWLIRHSQSFIAQFNFSTSSSNFNCHRFFESKFEELNTLAELSKKKNKSVRLWRTLPDKEREYIEENAFKASYDKKDFTQNSSNVKFYLCQVQRKGWNRLKELKNEQTILFIDDIRIGKILDFNQKDHFLIIKDIKCSIDEIPEKGELIEDIREQTSQFKKQVEACKKFEQTDVINPLLCSILATPENTIIPKSNSIHPEDYEELSENLFDKKLLNDETQQEAVLEALHNKPVFLIQGPPGTGKTTVIVELLRQILHRQKDVKILVTSQSNLAVDNVIEKLVKINEEENADLRFLRLASEHSVSKENISSEVIPHTFENKLKNWINSTEKRGKEYLSTRFKKQSKNKVLVEFYDFYSNLNKDTDWKLFNQRLRLQPQYIKQLFEYTNDFKAVDKLFLKQMDKTFLKLRTLQKDWIAFLGGTLINDKNGRKKSMLNNGSTEIDFLTAMIQHINIIGATCIHIASGKYRRVNFQFDYVIMDESSKASPAETLVPINMGKNIILIGDHKQLPPVITREKAIKQKIKKELEDNGLDFDKEFGESLFEQLIKAFEDDEDKSDFIKMLDVQYRMPRQIGKLISKYFYGNKLKNVNQDVSSNYDKDKSHLLKLKKNTSLVFLSTSQLENHNDNDNKFKRENKCNVQTIQGLLKQLNELYQNNLEREKPFTIGIIAGYRGQVELLKKSINLSQYDNFIQKSANEEGVIKKNNLIEINTVDKFQGAERDIIIYDVVRSSKGKSNIGFLDDYRRINVAFSRVKRLLIVVGDSEYLMKRATLNERSKFKEFKLQQIVNELNEKGLIVNNFKEILL